MNATTETRDVTAILADIDSTEPGTHEARRLSRELVNTVRTQLAPLPEGEAERMAAEADRDARTMAPPVPGVTRNAGYVVRAVIHVHDAEPGSLAKWVVACEDPDRGSWVTWSAYMQDGAQAGRLSYDGGAYFMGPDAAGNKRGALGSLAVRAGTMPEVAHRIADDILSYAYVEPEDKRMARRLRRYFSR